ncbi:MAG: helix-turn-helix transcriptional regulator [Pseudomonadota bacterium]
MSSFDAEIGTRIRTLRKALGLTQTELADTIGVRFQQIQKYENGSNRIAASTLNQVAEALGISVVALYRDNDDGIYADHGCSELLDLYMRLPKAQRAEMLFKLRATSARMTSSKELSKPVLEHPG